MELESFATRRCCASRAALPNFHTKPCFARVLTPIMATVASASGRRLLPVAMHHHPNMAGCCVPRLAPLGAMASPYRLAAFACVAEGPTRAVAHIVLITNAHFWLFGQSAHIDHFGRFWREQRVFRGPGPTRTDVAIALEVVERAYTIGRHIGASAFFSASAARYRELRRRYPAMP